MQIVDDMKASGYVEGTRILPKMFTYSLIIQSEPVFSEKLNAVVCDCIDDIGQMHSNVTIFKDGDKAQIIPVNKNNL